MTLRDEYLKECHGDQIEAAALLALRLHREDPQVQPVTEGRSYTRPNAILAAVIVFPEVTAQQIIARNYPHGWAAKDAKPEGSD